MFMAAENGNVAAIKQQIKLGTNVNIGGAAPLFLAAQLDRQNSRPIR
jgi:hypothetical protein